MLILPDPNWHTHVLAGLIRAYEDPVYWEIGVAGGASFNIVAPFCVEAVGVDIDPACGGFITKPLGEPDAVGTQRQFFPCSSDEFFANVAPKLHMPHVIFIDGNHSYEQVSQDLFNSVACIKRGGVIALHDTYPGDEDPTGRRCGEAGRVVQEYQAYGTAGRRPIQIARHWMTTIQRFPGLSLLVANA